MKNVALKNLQDNVHYVTVQRVEISVGTIIALMVAFTVMVILNSTL